MEKRKLSNEGFSLVELIVVIAIMAILVGSLAPQFMKYVESSRQSTDMQNASALKTTIEAYVAEQGLSGTTTITVKTDGTNLKVEDSASDPVLSTELSTALADVGLSGSITCKSTGWPTVTVATYSCQTYKWTPATGDTAKNTKKPNKLMSDVFK